MLLLIKDSLETPLEWHGTKFKTPCGIAIGFNMQKKTMVELKSKEVPNNINLFAIKLKGVYDELSKA
jgi:hypothetical protein